MFTRSFRISSLNSRIEFYEPHTSDLSSRAGSPEFFCHDSHDFRWETTITNFLPYPLKCSGASSMCSPDFLTTVRLRLNTFSPIFLSQKWSKPIRSLLTILVKVQSREFREVSSSIVRGARRIRRLRCSSASEDEAFRSLPIDRPLAPPFRSFRWFLAELKSKSGSKAEAIPGLKTQLRPHSSNARPSEPAYPLVAGVAVPPLHRSDKERRCSRS